MSIKLAKLARRMMLNAFIFSTQLGFLEGIEPSP